VNIEEANYEALISRTANRFQLWSQVLLAVDAKNVVEIVGLPFNQFMIQKRSDASFAFIDPVGCYSDLSLHKRPHV
jgi:hypothetical protein